MPVQRVRKIIHLDMDAFYASVEVKDNPSLAGQPVVVGGNPRSRGVVAAASYKAREYGIHSAMSCSRAHRLCPNAIFIPPRFHRYQEISMQIQEIFQRYTDLIEPVSLDEAWLDVSQNHLDCPSATWVAERIKGEILAETGLTASAGVSYNKFLAKIASDERKPNGLFVITPEQAQDFLKEISVRKIPGVGKVTSGKLRTLGVEKGYQLLEKSEVYLLEHFGKLGGYLHQIIRGIDNRPVVASRERKSVGIENTFHDDCLYGSQMKEALDNLLTGLLKRLNHHKKEGRTISLKVKFFDFQQITRSVTLTSSNLDEMMITRLAHQKLKEVALKEFPGKRIRLLGVSVSGFCKDDAVSGLNQQLDIYDFLHA